MKLRNRGHVDWERARELRASGMTYDSIAAELGCSLGSVYYACNATVERKKREQRRDAGEAQTARTEWSRDLIVERFRIYHELTGRVPRDADLGRDGLPAMRTVQRHIGSLREAQEAAGFEPRGVGRPAKRLGVQVAW